MDDATLTHYGVVGMKWGVRRTPEQLARSAGRSAKRDTGGKGRNGESKKADTPNAGKKVLSELSDDELRQRISRLELEKRYRDLEKAEAQPKSNRGREFVITVLENVGKNTLTNLGTQAANHVLGEAINKIAGVNSDDKAHRVVNPQKGQEDKK